MSRRPLTAVSVVLACMVVGCGTPPFGEGVTASQVVSRLKQAGMPIGEVTELNPQSDPDLLLGRPGHYTSKAFFSDTRLGANDERVNRGEEADAGGSVEVFADEDDAEQRVEFVQGRIAESGGPPLNTVTPGSRISPS